MNPTIFEFTIISMLVRGALFSALALLVGTILLRRSSAQTLSHFWRGCLIALCALPLISTLLPAIPILPAKTEATHLTANTEPLAVSATQSTVTPETSNEAALAAKPTITETAKTNLPWIAIIWLAGVAIVLSRWLVAMLSVRQVWQTAQRLDGKNWGLASNVRLRRSASVRLPMTWGARHPAILLPEDAENWDPQTRQTVIDHELAHARNGDFTFLLISQVAAAIHWANPLAWLIRGNLRNAQERAADDSVLATGRDASNYAETLLSFAKQTSHPIPLPLSAMATPSTVGKRIERLLDNSQSRQPLSRTSLLLGAILLTASATVVATAAQETPPAAKTKTTSGDRGEANRSKLREIIIPKVSMDGINLTEAIDFLTAEVKRLDPKKKGVPFKVIEENLGEVEINLWLNQVPASDALKFIADLANTDYLILSTGVELGKDIAKGRKSKNFQVPEKLASKINASPNPEKYWAGIGVEFPDGSAIGAPTDKGGRMTVTQLPLESLAIIERHIAKAIESGDKPTKTYMEEKLESIVIPKIELKQATLEQAIELLRRKAMEFDPTENPNHRGVNVLIRQPLPAIQPITISLENANLLSIVQKVAAEADCEVSLDPIAVIFRGKNEGEN